ncbi:MAG: hypothetical protein EBR82_28125 [Caulobacteraceae bacterium]|nr:hypothetical protein [Caulobacteraceae bacterium]
MSTFRRDFESVEQYRKRMALEDQDDEALTVETDIGAVLDALPPPLLFDRGPMCNSPAMERAIRAEEDRITRLDRRDKGG